ncbi:MAG: hypothetical protein M1368_02395, partial [Thaumarchaeota archaeon]|nr:hypothetical protein [Nitrososphaerota archaeon]
MKSPLTMEQYLSSRVIADPIRMFDACIPVNGGLSFIVASNEKAKTIAKDRAIKVLGIAESDNYFQGSILRPDITYLGIADSARRAFEISGVKHSEVDFFE